MTAFFTMYAMLGREAAETVFCGRGEGPFQVKIRVGTQIKMIQQEESAGHRSPLQNAGLILGPFLFCLVLLVDLEPGNPLVTRMAAVAVWMAAWWITEAIPLAVTALLPLVCYPLLGILSGRETAPTYANSVLFLFLGGFMIAVAMEKWNLHKRIALRIIRSFGTNLSSIILSFMVASAFLSMWISNTATAIMMVPMGLAIIRKMEEEFDQKQAHGFAVALMLGIAYGCSIGGIATLVGTPPNLSLVRIIEITFPEAPPITFAQWMLIGVPVTVCLLGLSWVVLTKVFFRELGQLDVDRKLMEKQYTELGRMHFEEKAVLLVTLTTALLWIFREKTVLGFITLPGWSGWLPYPKLIDDGTVALAMALTLFLIPSCSQNAPTAALITANEIKLLPWHIVLLFGGGFALAEGFQVTGLSTFVGHQLSGLAGVHPLVMIGVICLTLTFLTEVNSNTASTQMILPILASVAIAMRVHPLLFMVPATLSASCAFMMPVATPPNAIVFGSGRIQVVEMARVGVVLNLAGALLITIIVYLLAGVVFGVDLDLFPEWAQ